MVLLMNWRNSAAGFLLMGGPLLLAACAASATVPITRVPAAVAGTETSTTSPPSSTTQTSVTTTIAHAPPSPYARPDWLGTRLLPLRPDAFGEVQPTPPELHDRPLQTLDLLPPPSYDR